MTDPMYRRIAEDLQGKIESGEIARGSQLPTEIELRERFDASRNTVRDAIKWLITRGLVETRPGQGTYVVEKIEPFVSTLALATGPDSESNVYASEVQALKALLPANSRSQMAQQLSSGTSSALSMAPLFPCRHPFTQCASSSKVPCGSYRHKTLRRARFGILRRRSKSSRSADTTGLQCARQMPMKPVFSGCQKMGAFQCLRSSEQVMTNPARPCG
jgi:DNA-binding transcriptional MocR family regulator